MKAAASKKIARVQVGARMEKRVVKVLKALAQYLDLSLGDLLEGMALHAFEGKSAFQQNAGSSRFRVLMLFPKEIPGPL